MGRPLRIEYPGAYYHMTARGNEGTKGNLGIEDNLGVGRSRRQPICSENTKKNF